MTFSFASPTFTKSTSEESTRMREAIAQADLFTTISVDAINDLAERASLRRIPAHGTIVSQDEPGDSMFLIVTGRVKVGIFGENVGMLRVAIGRHRFRPTQVAGPKQHLRSGALTNAADDFFLMPT